MSDLDRDPDLVDAALRDEIEMVGDLVVAAADSEDHLTQDRIDKILGVQALPEDTAAGEHAEQEPSTA